MAIRIVRLGSPRAPGEGLRLGTVRRPLRGVPKTEHASRDFYDVWLPDLAPSESLLKEGRHASDNPMSLPNNRVNLPACPVTSLANNASAAAARPAGYAERWPD